MSSTRRILMVVANPSVSTTTGWPVGFWASELIHPYDAFRRKGYQVTIASPRGGKVEMDAYSDPRDPSNYSKDDRLSLQYLNNPAFVRLLENTTSVENLSANDFDAVVVAGGQSPMFTFEEAAALQNLFLDFYNRGKVSSALCHGTSLLLYLKDANGEPFVKGKTMTGFANSEEDFADKAVGQKLMPFRIEDEASKLGASFITAPAFQPHALRYGRLITGQQQHSGAEVAKLVIEALEQQGELDGFLSIAFFGVGRVGSALADHLARLGHTVSIAAHGPNSLSIKAAQAKNTSLMVKPIPEAVAKAQVIFLATPFKANEAVLKNAGDLTGKILVDCTNPIGPGMTHGLNSELSGGEFVQKLVPGAKVIKAFSVYGYENLADNHYPGYGELRPAMLIAGNDPDAKKTVSTLCRQLGWEPVDTGDISMSLHLEYMTLLWAKIGRAQGRGPCFVWAILKR